MSRAGVSVDYVVGYLDSWEESKHPRDEGGKFSETAAGKQLAGHSAGAVASAERAPGKEGAEHSRVAHAASHRALETDRPEDHTWARDLHKAASESHAGLAKKHANYAGPNGDHGAARQGHAWTAAAHQERLNALWKEPPSAMGQAAPHGTYSSEAIARRAEEERRQREANRSLGALPGAKKDSTAVTNPLDEVLDAARRFDSKFGELVGKLEHEGKSKEYATKIAAKVGREKIGAHEMAVRAAKSRAEHGG